MYHLKNKSTQGRDQKCFHCEVLQGQYQWQVSSTRGKSNYIQWDLYSEDDFN
jgi:hypothetical protein